MMDPYGEKPDDLTERIRQAEAKPEPEDKAGPSRNAGFDFAGVVVGAGVIGGIIDYVFKTSPWGLLSMVLLGFAAGIVTAWRAMQGSNGS